jgi:predicted CoA-binding protein
MPTLNETVADFLAQKRIAVAGVSRKEKASPANAILHKLRGAGYEVFPVNPNADIIENMPCFHRLAEIPGGVGGVVICTPAAASEQVVRECAELGIRRVWLHRSFGEGSIAPSAVELARKHGMSVIAGACPMMYVKPVDVAHACFRWLLRITGGLPKP